MHIYLVTNPHHEDAEEDKVVASWLRDAFDVTVVDITAPLPALGPTDHCMVRNAWPSSRWGANLTALRDTGARLYNPWHRRGYVEDKHYLRDLYQKGYAVPPTVKVARGLVGHRPYDPGVMESRWMIKPLNGSGSEGVEEHSFQDLIYCVVPFNGTHIAQMKVPVRDEISFYYLDNQRLYATVSAGPDKRWDLKQYSPQVWESAWAEHFVRWNKLPYGLQRIDAVRTPEGHLWLMEIEDSMPYLSLDVLQDGVFGVRPRVRTALVDSVKKWAGIS